GIFEEKDGDLLRTALRETSEELHFAPRESRVVACLPRVFTSTGFEVAPFVAVMDRPPEFTLNEKEVEEVLEPSLIALLATERPEKRAGGVQATFWHGHHRIWGATAAILTQLASIHTSRRVPRSLLA
ncbi:MAG: NUDIX hydrolase, partial [Nitrospinales bacterium]